MNFWVCAVEKTKRWKAVIRQTAARTAKVSSGFHWCVSSRIVCLNSFKSGERDPHSNWCHLKGRNERQGQLFFSQDDVNIAAAVMGCNGKIFEDHLDAP